MGMAKPPIIIKRQDLKFVIYSYIFKLFTLIGIFIFARNFLQEYFLNGNGTPFYIIVLHKLTNFNANFRKTFV